MMRMGSRRCGYGGGGIAVGGDYRSPLVILSEAKDPHLEARANGQVQILRFAQDDRRGSRAYRSTAIVSRGLLAVLFVAATSHAHAQEPIPRPLTLADALQVASENNPTYRIARAELENIPALERSMWLSYLPRPNSLTFGTNYNQRRSFTAIDEFGRPARVDDPVVAASSGSSQGLAWGQVTLFDGGARLAEARSDRARASGIRASVETAAIELRARLTRLYHNAVAAEAEIALHERMLVSARQAMEGTERLFRVGLKDPLDLLGAELQVAEREQALERARGAARSARLALGHEMGLGREVDAALADGFPEPFDPSALDVDALVARTLDTSPSIAGLESSVEVAAQAVGMARSQRWPTVALGFNTSRGVSARDRDALFELNPLDQTYGVSLSLRVPLFDQINASDAITQARVGRTAAEERLRAGRLQVESRVRGGVLALENAWREIGLAERTAELTRQRMELATQKYELGGASFDELRTASDDAFTREYAVLTARQTFANAVLDLEEAVGATIR